MAEDANTFAGGVLCDQVAGGRSGARLRLAPDSLIATASNGCDFAIRYGECRIEIGGYNGRMVFCRTADRSLTIFCDHRRFGP